MTRDKAALVIEGQPVLGRIDRLVGELDRVPTYSLREDQLDLLPPGRKAIHDRWPDVGPLGGIATALDHFRGEAILAIPVDMPYLRAEHLRRLLDHEGAPAVCFRAGSRTEPLPSLWMPECRQAVIREVGAGRLAVHRALERVDAELLDVNADVLRSINDPEDLREFSRASMS